VEGTGNRQQGTGNVTATSSEPLTESHNMGNILINGFLAKE
jgi:hypothetical protein